MEFINKIPQFFGAENDFLFWFCFIVVIIFVFLFVVSFFSAKEEAKEEARLADLISNQTPKVLTWKGKTINIISSLIAGNVVIENVIIDEQRNLKVIFKDREEFIQIVMPFEEDGRKITAMGSLIIPSTRNETVSSLKRVVTGPLGMMAAVATSSVSPVLGVVGATAWGMAQGATDFIEFIFID